MIIDVKIKTRPICNKYKVSWNLIAWLTVYPMWVTFRSSERASDGCRSGKLGDSTCRHVPRTLVNCSGGMHHGDLDRQIITAEINGLWSTMHLLHMCANSVCVSYIPFKICVLRFFLLHFPLSLAYLLWLHSYNLSHRLKAYLWLTVRIHKLGIGSYIYPARLQ